MNTLLLSILVANLVLEAACAFLIYRKRYQIRFALQRFLGIDEISGSVASTNYRLSQVQKKLRFIRRHQKAEAAAVNAQYGRKVI